MKTPRSAVAALALSLTAIAATLAGVVIGLRIVQANLGAASRPRLVAFAQVLQTQVAVADKTSGETNGTTRRPPGASPAAQGALPWVRPARPTTLPAASSLRSELATDGEFSGALFAAMLLPIFWYALFSRRRGSAASPKKRTPRQRTRTASAADAARGLPSAELLAAPVVEVAERELANRPVPSARPAQTVSAARTPPRAEPRDTNEVGGRTTLRRVTVSGSPPWDPAPEPTGEFPWATAPERRSGLPRLLVPEGHERHRHTPPAKSSPASDAPWRASENPQAFASPAGDQHARSARMPAATPDKADRSGGTRGPSGPEAEETMTRATGAIAQAVPALGQRTSAR